jgi:putative toxin-antitoxin system antitoxin component (TIGR02293 family)
MNVAETVEAMGGQRSVGRVGSVAELEAAVRRGLPKATLTALAARFAADDVGRRRFIYSIVPRATWERRQTLTPQASERVERLARLWSQAEAVWGDEALTRRFMTTAHAELEGQSPVEAAATELGGRRVERVLNALAYGLPV